LAFPRFVVCSRWRFQYFHEPLREARIFENFSKQDQAKARIGVAGYGEQGTVEIGVAGEAFGSGYQPEVKFVFEGADVGDEFVLIAFGIIDQVAGMHFEEFGEEHAGGVGEVRARSGFDLREVALRDGFAELFLDKAREFDLGDFAIEAAESAFDFAEIAEFFTESHITI
jgi:hypothetical protein